MNMKILIIDDEPLILMTYEVEAEILNISCATATTVAGGMAVDLKHIQAAILDVRLPDGNIFPLARRLRDAGIPFLFCTGTTFDIPDREFNDIIKIAKPVGAFKVIASVLGLISSSG